MSLTEEDVVKLFVEEDQKLLKGNSLVLGSMKTRIEKYLDNNLSEDQIKTLGNTLKKYRKWKDSYFKKFGYNYIIQLASSDTLFKNKESIPEDEVPPKKNKLDEKSPNVRRPKLSFLEIGGQRRKQRTDALLDNLKSTLEAEFPELSLNQLLGYLLYRTNLKGNHSVADIGLQLFEERLENIDDFDKKEAIAFMHNLTLTREQIRKVRHVLKNKGIHFPTTNELLEGRKKLRPVIQQCLGSKGVCVDYTELVRMTTRSAIDVVIEENKYEKKEGDKYKMFFKDGGDGAGQQRKLKSKEMIESKQNMFQYGITPLKLVCTNEKGKDIVLWENPSPNSCRSLRPVYLIREEETNSDLVDLVITTTDRARSELNKNGLVLEYGNTCIDITFLIQDTMKDMKLKRNISGLKGAGCILCDTRTEDWTTIEKVKDGFTINRSAEESMRIYNELVDEDGNIPRSSNDFEQRKGLTAKPITTSDQHSICITHSYINCTTWFLKLLYRCYTDYKCWIERKDLSGEPIRRAKEDVLEILIERHGLELDSCAGACDKTGTSTTGEQRRRFFSEEVLETLEQIIPTKYNENLLQLHLQLSVILRVVSYTGQIDVDAYQKLCLDFSY